MSDKDTATLRYNAKRCWRQARAATDPREKAAWVELAVGWTELALDLPMSSEEAVQRLMNLARTEQDKLN